MSTDILDRERVIRMEKYEDILDMLDKVDTVQSQLLEDEHEAVSVEISRQINMIYYYLEQFRQQEKINTSC